MEGTCIKIGIFGCVSVGKSTFLNAISGVQYSDVEMRRTTMIPQAYKMSANEGTAIEESIAENSLDGLITNATNALIIRRKNKDANLKTLDLISSNKFTKDQCQPIYHEVDRIYDLFGKDVLHPDIKVIIYDLPGLNDSIGKKSYFQWMEENVNCFDILIFMTDITKGLNSADELDILKMLMKNIHHSARMICLMNKCDDICYNESTSDHEFEDQEQFNIFSQANKILTDVSKNYPDIKGRYTPFLPISSENCYIYRALKYNPGYKLDMNYVNRLGKNEYGQTRWKRMTKEENEEALNKIISELSETYCSKIRDTGYLLVAANIREITGTYVSSFFIGRLEDKLKEMKTFVIVESNDYVMGAIEYVNQVEAISKVIDSSRFDPYVYYDKLWNALTDTVNRFWKIIGNLNTHIIVSSVIESDRFVNYDKFANVHNKIVKMITNIQELEEYMHKYETYPYEFINNIKNNILGKLRFLYDQLTILDVERDVHTSVENILIYLKYVEKYMNECFPIYITRFLTVTGKEISFKLNDNQKKHILVLINYLMSKGEYNNVSKFISSIITTEILNITNYDKEDFFIFLIVLKDNIINTRNMINPLASDRASVSKCLLLTLEEMVNNKISMFFNQSSILNIRRYDFEKHMSLLRTVYDNTFQENEMDFEKELLKYLIQ